MALDNIFKIDIIELLYLRRNIQHEIHVLYIFYKHVIARYFSW